MPKERLHELLREVHDDLASQERVDDESAAMLRVVLEDIHRVLDQPTAPRPPQTSLSGRLRDIETRLEADHPTIASLLSQITEALRNLGI